MDVKSSFSHSNQRLIVNLINANYFWLFSVRTSVGGRRGGGAFRSIWIDKPKRRRKVLSRCQVWNVVLYIYIYIYISIRPIYLMRIKLYKLDQSWYRVQILKWSIVNRSVDATILVRITAGNYPFLRENGVSGFSQSSNSVVIFVGRKHGGQICWCLAGTIAFKEPKESNKKKWECD